jgi:hypothetical protein
MVAPRLVQVAEKSPAVSGRLRFVVERGGQIGDLRVEAGDVIVCGGEVRDGEVTPRVGWVRGIRLVGEVGEPCDVERWHPAGRILALVRARDAACLEAAPQLSLFRAA